MGMAGKRNCCGGTEGVRKIAARFGVDPSTVQRINRPFDASADFDKYATI
jgi:hypothetical protein